MTGELETNHVRLLLADNDADFLAGCGEFLQSHGYRVVLAESVEAARFHLANTHFHIAILDMRLRDNSDDKDFSGIDLAKNSEGAVLTIIQTNYKNWESVREAMATTRSGKAPAFYYVDKKEGPEFLLQQVERAATSLRINWGLRINWHETDLLSLAVSLGAEVNERQALREWSDELLDLLRMTFFEATEVRIEKLLWQHQKRAALFVQIFPDGKPPDAGVLVCGEKTQIGTEAKNFMEFAPRPAILGTVALTATSASSHFAANLYQYGGRNLNRSRPLGEVFLNGPNKVFTSAIETLMEKTLPGWHRHTRLLTTQPLKESYRLRACLPEATLPVVFHNAVRDLAQPATTLGVTLRCESGQLKIRIAGQEYSYPDPTELLQGNDDSRAALVFVSPGRLDGQTIWVDPDAHPLLTDFLCAGPAPVLSHCVELEAAVRFDGMTHADMGLIHEWEKALGCGDFLNVAISEVAVELRKPLRAVRLIRGQAVELLDGDPRPYHLGLLFEAARRLSLPSTALSLTRSELMSRLHLVLGAAVLSGAVSVSGPVEQLDLGIRVDPAVPRRVWVNGVQRDLTRQSHQLLSYLLERTGEVCSPGDVLVHGLGERAYDPADQSQAGRLDQAIHRLRKHLESDPKHPQLLRRDGSGYRLRVRS